MATDIVHLEVGQALPVLPDDSNRGIYAVAWRGAVPQGVRMFKPGEDRGSLREWLGSFGSAQDRLAAALDGSAPKATIAICTRDRPRALRACLEACRRQNYQNFNVLVVDNGETSRDAVLELCREFKADYTSESRPGIVYARNRAVMEAAGDLIAFIDDDCTPAPDWLHCAAAEFARSPGVGCCTGPILPRELETPAQELMESRGGFSRGFERRVYTEHSEKDSMPAYPLQAWLFGSGGNMVFRKRVLRQIGGFDDFMDIGEDLDIFYRTLRAGHELVYSPGTVVMHSHVRERHGLRRRFYRWGTAYLTFLSKVAIEDPGYRAMACREILNWFRFQLGQRSTELASGFPADLYAAEVLGGISGASASWLRYCHHSLTAQRSKKVQKVQDRTRG